MEFPTLFYREGGPHNAGGTRTFDFIAVANDDQAADRAAEGWFPSLTEALASEQDPDTMSDRSLLEQAARELGVSFNSRTSDQVLIERITEKRAE